MLTATPRAVRLLGASGRYSRSPRLCRLHRLMADLVDNRYHMSIQRSRSGTARNIETSLESTKTDSDTFGSVGSRSHNLKLEKSRLKPRETKKNGKQCRFEMSDAYESSSVIPKIPKSVKRAMRPVSNEADTFGTLTVDRKGSIAEIEQDFGAFQARASDSLLAKEEKELLKEECETLDGKKKWGKLHPPVWYRDECEKLAQEGKINECVAMFEVRMLKRDKVEPLISNFHAVLRAVASAGYTKKAFEIREKMASYGLVPHLATYVMLLTACANCPFPEYGLAQASAIRKELQDRELPLNRYAYNAMLRAYSRHGDLATCWEILDEMKAEGVHPDQWSYNVLLQNASSDESEGFSFALKLLTAMRKNRITRTPSTYCSLLTACLKGGISDAPATVNLVNNLMPKRTLDERKQISEERNIPTLEGARILTADPLRITDVVCDEVKITEKSAQEEHLAEHEFSEGNEDTKPISDASEVALSSRQTVDSVPERTSGSGIPGPSRIAAASAFVEQNELDIQAASPLEFEVLKSREPGQSSSGTIASAVASQARLQSPRNELLDRPKQSRLDPDGIDVDVLLQPMDRLALFGGVKGFLANMRRDRVPPNVIIFCQLLECLPNGRDSTPLEIELLSLMNRLKIDPNLNFLNRLMRRRADRGDRAGVEVVDEKFNRLDIQRDVMTYVYRIPTVRGLDDASELLQELEKSSLTPGSTFFSTLLIRACHLADPTLASHVLQQMQRRRVHPSLAAVKTLRALALEVARSKRTGIESLQPTLVPRPEDDPTGFLKQYNSLLSKGSVRAPHHPWAKLEQPVPLKNLYRPHERRRENSVEYVTENRPANVR